eukprot:scaffold13896_cov75-Cylindrotheca_fusiformis.AAC.1
MARRNRAKQRNIIVILFLLACGHFALLTCDAFQNMKPGITPPGGKHNFKVRPDTALHVLAEPPKDLSNHYGSPDQSPSPKRLVRRKPTNNRSGSRKDDVWSSGRWERAVVVESRLRDSLAALEESIKIRHEESGTKLDQYPLPFPGIRECNAALASFGDGGDLLRALRLYFKMWKTSLLSQQHPARKWQPVPIPTLVTFSTALCSRLYSRR